jgi:hypothetical protein
MIDRVRHFLVATSRAAMNSAGVRTGGIYRSAAELAGRYGLREEDLTRSELKVFSQNGEDGVIQEILSRVGTTERTFVEFGAGDGSESNCVFLAHVLGWSGVFVEADPASFATLSRRYAHVDGVRPVNATLEPGTIERTLLDAGAATEPDVMSIDVDGNDFHLWRALERIRPRVLVIEYNAAFDPRVPRVQPYSAAGPDGTVEFGASVAALRELGAEKGYRFVHTELAGVNAFFVRSDLAGDRFLPEDEVPVRPPNYYLENATMHRPAPGV